MMEPVFLIPRIRAENVNKDLILEYAVKNSNLDSMFNNNHYYYSYQAKNIINLESYSTNLINIFFNNELSISWKSYLNSTSSNWINENANYSSLYYNILNKDGDFVFNFKTEGTFPYIIKNILDDNKNLLWSYKICIHEIKTYRDEEIFNVQFLLFLDTKKLYNLIKKNKKLKKLDIEAIYFLIFYKNQMNKKSFNPGSDLDTIWKNNTVKNLENNITQPDNIKLKLYTYQLKGLNWMHYLENNIGFDFNTYIPLNLVFKNKNLKKYSINFFEKNIIENSKIKINQKIYSNGGILADEMGLGKTITTIALISSKIQKIIPNYSDDSTNLKIKKSIFKQRSKIFYNNTNSHEKKFYDIPLIHTKSNLIICPNHLSKQWELEIKKCNPGLKTILLLSKTNHKKISVNDIINSDVVIVSFQFLSNINYYINICDSDERTCNIDEYYGRLTNSMIVNRFNERLFNIYKIHIEEFKNNLKDFLNIKQPFLEIFNWNRVIIDEGHEIFGEIDHYNCDRINNYLKHLVNHFKSNYKWYISGTPFVNTNGLLSVCKFLNINTFKKLDNNVKIKLNFNQIINEGFDFNFLYKTFLDNFYYRNTKDSVKDELNIPSVIEQVLYINFTDIEKSIYDSHINYGNTYLRQFCCHPQISNIDRNTFGNSEISLEEVRQKIIDDKTIIKEKLIKTLNELKSTTPNYEERKKKYETKITELTYLINFFKSIDPLVPSLPEENCIICLSEFVDPIVTGCGHYFCKECISNSVKYGSKNCPMCRKVLKNEEIYHVECKNKNSGNIDTLTFKYGSKLGKLIPLCKQILQNPDSKIIIFSQWDRLLNMIASILKENDIQNVFCKGNVYQRSNAILSFRKNLETKKKKKKINRPRIIMLSTENAASGTNLTEATHVIFMDPVNGTKEEIKSIEDQAVGRAVRIGQVNQVKAIRLITKDTIEEEIFKKTHDSNITSIQIDTSNTSKNVNNNVTVI